jgi:hypothetical protein
MYAWLLENFAGEPIENSSGLIDTLAALAAGRALLEEAGSEDDRIAAEIWLARAFRVTGQTDLAAEYARAALDAAEAAGWDDGAANGILRDLAVLSSDKSAAGAYEERARGCPVPCAEDRAFRIGAEASTLVTRLALPLSAQWDRARLDAVAGIFGEGSAPYALEAGAIAAELRQDRPFLAVEYRRREVMAWRALPGLSADDPRLLNAEYDLGILLLRAGTYVEARTVADRLSQELRTLESPSPALRSLLGQALRLRGRTRFHLGAEDMNAAYGEAVDYFQAYGGDEDELLQDLIDADLGDLAARIAGNDISRVSLNNRRSALARLAARRGDWDGAAEITRAQVTALKSENAADSVAVRDAFRIQLAAYLAGGGHAEQAAEIRASVPPVPADVAGMGTSWGNADFGRMFDIRDFGAYEAAAYIAGALLDDAEGWKRSGSYQDAQHLWQLSYTFSKVGQQDIAFPLMRRAAEIALDQSLSAIDATGGGSLELLRRDRSRYLLFLDIAWGAKTGEPPQDMLISARY